MLVVKCNLNIYENLTDLFTINYLNECKLYLCFWPLTLSQNKFSGHICKQLCYWKIKSLGWPLSHNMKEETRRLVMCLSPRKLNSRVDVEFRREGIVNILTILKLLVFSHIPFISWSGFVINQLYNSWAGRDYGKRCIQKIFYVDEVFMQFRIEYMICQSIFDSKCWKIRIDFFHHIRFFCNEIPFVIFSLRILINYHV